jgi:serine/threonine protein kinase
MPDGDHINPGPDALSASSEFHGLDPGELFARGLHTVKPTVGASGWEPPTAEEAGRLLPQYRIEKLLGRGGMGAVYKGAQLTLDRTVAIKLLPAELAIDAEFVVRFQREARILARLQHARIITIYEFGQTSEGHLYFVMEYVDGTNLREILRGPGLDPEQALAVVGQLCDALQAAHREGIVHRDIKPENVLVTKDGDIKLADFGLARPPKVEGFENLTRSNVVMGTPAYMAPEQHSGAVKADHRSDIFALGVMLYEMLTGQPPRGAFALPSSCTRGVQVDVRIDEVVLKALQTEPDRRYQMASEMKTDVERIRTTPLPVSPPEVPKRRQGRQVLLTAAVLIPLLAVAGSLFRSKHAPPVSVPSVGMASKPGPGSTPAAVRPEKAAPLVAATKEAPFVNTLQMKFVPVPGTSALFSIWDTRVRDYAAYARAKNVFPAWTEQEKDGMPVSREPEYPVVGVSWVDADEFCKWLTRKESDEGTLPSGMRYRLPTDAEWSFAAGLGLEEGTTPAQKRQHDQVDFPWGVGFPPKPNSGNYADASWHEKFPNEPWIEGYSDGFSTTSPVGSFPANAFGLYDMGGNVWQFCQDYFDGEHKQRVTRGAGWRSRDRDLLYLSARMPIPAGSRDTASGFRCVLDVVPPAPVPVTPGSATKEHSPGSATKEQPFVNSLGMKFVPIPGDSRAGDAAPKHVLFSIWETRVRDFTPYIEANPDVQATWLEQEKFGVPVSREPNYPVVGISWDDGRDFCEWLTAKERTEGRLGPGARYRMPMDDEWSRAVGLPPEEGATPAEKNGKNQVDFPWGVNFPPSGAKVGNYADSAYHGFFVDEPSMEKYTDGFALTSPVGSFPPNSYGIYDMGGNAWEWCVDWFDATHLSRVLRGASYTNNDRLNLLSSRRISDQPEMRHTNFGLRCVLELGEAALPHNPASR